ncbi:ParB/RepB/Spo0J family partition protein [Staphylococcus auricularis]|uniref:ParB/RepB/Spo0J family partition protein n=1 Tax=Staphylococcus auricularis TaxID=29379 RepID=UPI00248E84BE|nr:ParB/RepB/Spo0J family partition protein [Staphylococcus auricularis]
MAMADDQRTKRQDNETVQMIDLDQIRANPYQPRKLFDDDRLEDLAQSIMQHGILQPIVLRKTIKGYHIVAGERRFRAAQKTEMTQIPAIVKKLTDADMMELAVIENLQREDLNAIEEAESYKQLMEQLDLTQQEVAKRLGKSRPYIANMLRLLQLPQSVRQMIQRGDISGGHGRALLPIKDPTQLKQIARAVCRESWSVRYLEKHVSDLAQHETTKQQKKNNSAAPSKPKMIQQQERQLKEQYGTEVSISTAKQKGRITFEFGSEDEFKALIRQLNHKYR